MEKFKLNKKLIKVSSLEENDEKDYWQLRTSIERLKAIELNRRIVYGEAYTSKRFQRFFEIVKFKKN